MSKSILVVDDDEEFCALAADLLRQRGYHVAVAHNGEDALRMILAGWLPNIIILDMVLQGMSGYELFDQLKSSKLLSHIPIIVVSGPNASKKFAWVVGLDKPLDADELLETVERYAR